MSWAQRTSSTHAPSGLGLVVLFLGWGPPSKLSHPAPTLPSEPHTTVHLQPLPTYLAHRWLPCGTPGTPLTLCSVKMVPPGVVQGGALPIPNSNETPEEALHPAPFRLPPCFWHRLGHTLDSILSSASWFPCRGRCSGVSILDSSI